MITVNFTGSKKKIPLTSRDFVIIVQAFFKIIKKKIDNSFPIVVNCRLVSKAEIIRLNKKWRKKVQPSAILAFPDYYLKQRGEPIREEVHLGDLVIAPEIIRTQAKKNFLSNNVTSFRLQFINSLIHSIAHLYGYTHDSEKKFLQMEAIEKQVQKTVIKKLMRN
jgi:rRNA maturation RNase YbeY